MEDTTEAKRAQAVIDMQKEIEQLKAEKQKLKEALDKTITAHDMQSTENRHYIRCRKCGERYIRSFKWWLVVCRPQAPKRKT